MTINILPNTLINQIAAGEMIERPASIVKELAENAMDAGATHINIDLAEGGIGKIVIADNGNGISADELPLALTRHATSKINSLADLVHVATMGFRGEALSSIASAAQVHINSANEGQTQSAQITADGGIVGQVEPAHRARGTTITVRNLFYNIPARRQFLKTATTEASHCLDACRRLALVNAHIGWLVRHNGRVVLDLVPHDEADEHKRWREVLGDSFFAHCRLMDEQLADSRLRGVLSLPSAMEKTRRDAQYIFVNGRFIRDRTLLHAIREGYAEMKHDAKQLSFALWLDIPADSVDVNVSPMKTEVRFRAASHMHQLVHQAVRKALSGVVGQYAAPTMSTSAAFPASPVSANTGKLLTTNYSSNQQAYAPSQPSVFHSRPSASSITTALHLADINNAAPATLNSEGNSNYTNNSEAEFPLGHALGLLHHLYILAQNHEGLVVVEVHAAHERILFEHLKQAHHAKESLTAQTLLVPWNIVINVEESETFTKHKETLKKLGLHGSLDDSNETNEQTLMIEAVPSMLPEMDYPALIRELLRDLADYGQSQALAALYEQVLATMACHGARRGKQNMSLAEMDSFLREMEKIERSGSCNHGRPSFSVTPLAEFDQFFMRGQ